MDEIEWLDVIEKIKLKKLDKHSMSNERRCPNHGILLKYNVSTGLHICPECGYVE